MNNNKVHNKILKFAIEEITFTQFYAFLMESTASNPIFVKSSKLEGGSFNKNVNWGPPPYPNGRALYDYEALGYMVVQSQSDGGDWRTIVLENVIECAYEGKRYRVR
jgi:hypothetical protein